MKKFLPHLTIAMAIAMAAITYVDDRNPMMGFLRSSAGHIYIYLFCAVAFSAALLFIVDMRIRDVRRYKKQQEKKMTKGDDQ
ncbi:MAG: hypothetical protein HUJ69_00700 [Lachnospiraceae bacterium]|nr:hypothetical protein [Lachnospiraceae bacterium]